MNVDGTEDLRSPAALDRLPDGAIIRDAKGDAWRQIDYPSKGTYWENLTNGEMYEQRSYAIPLPATLVTK